MSSFSRFIGDYKKVDPFIEHFAESGQRQILVELYGILWSFLQAYKSRDAKLGECLILAIVPEVESMSILQLVKSKARQVGPAENNRTQNASDQRACGSRNY